MRRSITLIKCINDQGKIKEFSAHIANNTARLRDYGWEKYTGDVPEDVPKITEETAPSDSKEEAIESKPEDTGVDLSAFDGANLKDTVTLIESGEYDGCLSDVYDLEQARELPLKPRKGVVNAIKEREQNKQ